jgi:uncharacterized protein YgiM (DUF1202 family)
MGEVDGYFNKSTDLHKVASTSDKYPVTSGVNGKAVTIIGKCNDWFLVKYSDGKTYWVTEDEVTYISLSDYSLNIYQFNTKNITAKLINSSKDKDIAAKSGNTNIATIKTADVKDGKKITVNALKPTEKGVVVTASYTFGSGQTISRSCKVIIEKAELTGVPSGTIIKQTGTSYSLSAGVSHFSKAVLTYASSNTAVATIDKSGKITAKTVGTATITVSFKSLKKSFTFKVIAKPAAASTSTSQVQTRDGGPYPSPVETDKGVMKWFDKLIAKFFTWDETQGVWRSTISSPQYIAGYNGFYDWIFEKAELFTYTPKEIGELAVKYETIAKLLQAIIDGDFKKQLNSGDNFVSHNKFISTFDFENYKGDDKRWLIEGWKGNYANLGAGSEIGTYYAKIPKGDKDPIHYFTVSKGKDKKSGDMQIIGFELHHDPSYPTLLFGLGPERHWWLSGFRRDVRNSNKNDLRMKGLITFNKHRMAILFRANFEVITDHGTGASNKNKNNQENVKKNIGIDGTTAIIKKWKYTELGD